MSDLARRFFAPPDLVALHAAVREAEARGGPPASEAWGGWAGDPTGWSRIELPVARPHPAAFSGWADAVRVPPEALQALVAEAVWVDDDGRFRLWPWYPEEEATERPLAAADAARLGVALPPRHLDAPYDPAWYFARSGLPSLGRVLAARGIDLGAGMVRVVPVPPLREFHEVRYPGGGRELPATAQALHALLARASDDPEGLDGLLSRVCRAFGASVVEPPPERLELEIPPSGAAEGDGRVDSVSAVDTGAVLGRGETWSLVGPDGQTSPRRVGTVGFAARSGVFVSFPAGGSGVWDLVRDRWCEGDWRAHAALFGVEAPPFPLSAWNGIPVRSACGLYDDEAPVVRLADGVAVGRLPRGRAARRPPLLDVDALQPGATVLSGIRFAVRRTPALVVPGRRSFAFTLAGARGPRTERWHWCTGDGIGIGPRTVARLGVDVHHAAWDATGDHLWVVTAAHLVRVAIRDGACAVDQVFALSMLLEAG